MSINPVSTTEASSNYDNLEKMEVRKLLENMNREDQIVPAAVKKSLHEIEQVIEALVSRMQQGGRLFYIGAGTSGRLGILDASEIPPTYGVDHNLVIGIIAGGDQAIRSAVEGAEDNEEQAWLDLQQYDINAKDTLIGIAASGRTPYVIGGLKTAGEKGIFTACITCNPGSAITAVAQVSIVAEVGPEFVTGSTRMKAGTAQKLILNMITTAAMIRLGKIKGNKMVDMQLSNDKLVNRGVLMITNELPEIDPETARSALSDYGSVRKAIAALQSKK